MVLLLLQIKADLENLTNLTAKGGSDGSDFTFYFKIRCGNCGADSDKRSSVTASEEHDIPKSRGTAHLVQKCKDCGRIGTVSVVEGRGRPYTAEDSEAGRFVPLACFDSRGIEPVEFYFGDGWYAEGLTGTKFADIDLSDGEIADYDEKAASSVGVYNLSHEFVTTK